MIPFPFTRFVPADRAELKAVLLALLFCGLFIGLLGVLYQPPRRKRVSNYMAFPTPTTPVRLLEPEPPRFGDLAEKSRAVPKNFRDVDFENHSFGFYRLSNGTEIELTLYMSALRLPDDLGWFSLKDVYYKDVTGDGTAEAIVRLSHVECDAASCEGADMFYIYTLRDGKLSTIWQYETGTRAYGCGLKSLTVVGKQLLLELFGRCPYQATENPRPSKFVVKDLTVILFAFDGRGFARESIQFFPTALTDVRNYEPPIRMF
ncbi:MAG TPA: hypothetical protein VKB02_12770 [Pyrinomonadaceae bacterium]|nr:hypothetical protein [Pyrinomonadaceae bacterium]